MTRALVTELRSRDLRGPPGGVASSSLDEVAYGRILARAAPCG